MNGIINLTAAFPSFYLNPAIRSMAPTSRWTISGRLGDDASSKAKAPIDARELIDHGRVRGAWELSDKVLVTLDELSDRIPTAANAAYYLRAPVDGLVVLDIEPSCPEDLALQLLALPGILYAETSMSGRGYHLVFPNPQNLSVFPNARGKRVLREANGHYEILIDHWVTFTRRPIPDDVRASVRSVDADTLPFDTIESLHASLASAALPSAGSISASVEVEIEAPEIPGAHQIVERTVEGATSRFKTLADFQDDTSRYEFSVLGTLHREMRTFLTLYRVALDTTFSPSDEAWLLYQAAVEVLPHRAKHNERRNRRPFLLDRAAAMVAANTIPYRKES